LDSTEDEIRTAFKKFVAKNHPDKASEERREAATKKFIEVKAAYDWLISNLEKKAA
jgi:DnaJ-class molecular chaperone